MLTEKLAGLEVYWSTGNFSDDFVNSSKYGLLTCDHAASSYGLPVLVDEDGNVYGPAEAPELSSRWAEVDAIASENPNYNTSERCIEIDRLIDGALAAGYKLAGLSK